MRRVFRRVGKIKNFFYRIKKNFSKGENKYYISNLPDLVSILYFLSFCFIASFLIVKYLFGLKIAVSVLLLPPLFLGIFIFYFLLPVRLFIFLVTQLILLLCLRKVKKNIPSKSVIIVGKTDYKSPRFWFSPNYDLDLLFLVEYLRVKKEDFSIYENIDIKTLDRIMSNKDIKTVYLLGHGRRHSFAVDSKIVVDYCRYDDPKFRKDFVYQLHCNHGGGKSLVEYVVPKDNWKECLPSHGYMSSMTITTMIADKIAEYKYYKGLKKQLISLLYPVLSSMVSTLALILWMIIFLKMMVS